MQAISLTKRLGVLLLLEVGWFALLHPLIPKTLVGFIVEFVAGCGVFVLLYGGVALLLSLSERSISRFLSIAVSLVIIIGIGFVIVGIAYCCRTFLTDNFAYGA